MTAAFDANPESEPMGSKAPQPMPPQMGVPRMSPPPPPKTSYASLTEQHIDLMVAIRVERIANMLDSRGMHDAAHLVRNFKK